MLTEQIEMLTSSTINGHCSNFGRLKENTQIKTEVNNDLTHAKHETRYANRVCDRIHRNGFPVQHDQNQHEKIRTMKDRDIAQNRHVYRQIGFNQSKQAYRYQSIISKKQLVDSLNFRVLISSYVA